MTHSRRVSHPVTRGRRVGNHHQAHIRQTGGGNEKLGEERNITISEAPGFFLSGAYFRYLKPLLRGISLDLRKKNVSTTCNVKSPIQSGCGHESVNKRGEPKMNGVNSLRNDLPANPQINVQHGDSPTGGRTYVTIFQGKLKTGEKESVWERWEKPLNRIAT